LQSLNITKEDLNDFFGGPAFLAWARMGNLHGYVNVIHISVPLVFFQGMLVLLSGGLS